MSDNVSNRLLTIENATVKQRQEVLFENLDFELIKGQHWAIVGESGSGKSALLKTFAGKHYLTKGKIEHHFFKGYVEKKISKIRFSLIMTYYPMWI